MRPRPRRQLSKIGLLTLVIGRKYREAVALGTATKAEYCNKHRYCFHCETRHLLPDLPAAWSKIPAAQAALAKHDFVILIDADTVIMNSEVRLEERIAELLPEGKSVCLVRDCFDLINSGVMVLRKAPSTLRLLDLMLEQTQFSDHPWWEQAAFIHLYDQHQWVRDLTHVLEDQRLLQSYPATYHPGDFIVHFAGVRAGDALEGWMDHFFARRDPLPALLEASA